MYKKNEKDKKMKIQIEKNIPIPTKRYKYPWNQMQVGDSFFVKSSKKETELIRGRLKSGSIQYAARSKDNKKFIVRIVNDPRGVRCWRIK
jgi:hypothetical protein